MASWSHSAYSSVCWSDGQINPVDSGKKLFDGHIDLTDYDSKPDDQRENAFLSRSLAAYSLTLLAEIGPEGAGPCVTDGFDDNGIDAVFFDAENEVL